MPSTEAPISAPGQVGAKARISAASAMTAEERMTSGLRRPIRSLSRPPITLVMMTMTAYRPVRIRTPNSASMPCVSGSRTASVRKNSRYSVTMWLPMFTSRRVSQAQAKSGYRAGEIQKLAREFAQPEGRPRRAAAARRRRS